jgi:hypothetical protein
MKMTLEVYAGIRPFALRTFTFFLLTALAGANGAWASLTCPNTTPMLSGFTDYSLGSAQEGIETGDFNNDGKADLISANNGGSVSVALGDGAGGFGTQQTTTLGSANGLRAIVVADFNSDGKLDFATANDQTANIAVGYGNGSGGFSSVAYYAVSNTGGPSESPTYITTGDFNNDGAVDLATSNGSSFSIFDNVSGAFSKRTNVTSAGGGLSIASGDLDSDGAIDVFLSKGGNPGTVAYNNGASAWTIYTPLSNTAVVFYASETGDFDQDGNKDDLVTAGVFTAGGGNSIVILTGNTNRTMTSAQATSITNYWGGGIKTGDFNADTKTDLALASGYQGGSANFSFVLLNQGAAQFGDVASVNLGSSHTTADTAVGDFDRDGKPDVATTAAFANSASVTLNRYNINATYKTDYNGDGRSDYVIWRPSTGVWWETMSYFNTQPYASFGTNNDVPVPGDYDGDKITDFAVFRPSNNNWYILPSSGGSFYSYSWGTSGDKLVPGDYDGDGKTDVAVWRPSDQTWYVIKSSNGGYIFQAFGNSTDIPIPGDYEGTDGKWDMTVYRPSDNKWYILPSTGGSFFSYTWGTSGDKLVPGDYDGDCVTDVAVYRPSDTTWYAHKSSDGGTIAVTFGGSNDVPQPADFDGDRKTDFAFWNSSSGDWNIKKSSNLGTINFHWGTTADIPAASIYPQ